MQPASNQGEADKKDRSGNSSLHLASQKGQTDAVRALVAIGAFVNLRNFEGETPLHLAAQGGHKAVVQILLDAGADPTMQDNNGATPCHLAASEGFLEIMELMSKRDENEETMEEDENLLESSEIKKHTSRKRPIAVIPCTKVKIAKGKMGESSNTIEPQPSTSKCGSIGNTIEQQPSTSKCGVTGNRSRMKTRSKSPELKDYFDVDWMADDMDCSLEEHVIRGAINEIRTGRDEPLCRHYEGYTPLHMAVRFGFEEAARRFVKKGASVHAKTESGIPMMILAASGGSVRIVKMLVQGGSSLLHEELSGLTPIHTAVYYGHEPLIRYFHSVGVDLDARETLGETALHIAARKRDLRAVITLLNLGASKDIANFGGVTPLMLAENNGDVHMQALLNHWKIESP